MIGIGAEVPVVAVSAEMEDGYAGSKTPLSPTHMALTVAGVGPTAALAFFFWPQSPAGAVSWLDYISTLSRL